jgi:hypothetical protein
MRRVAPIVAATTCVIAGCTLLIDFEEVPSNDAGADVVVTPPVDSGKIDTGTDAGADAPVDSAGFVTACKTKDNGKYCPGNMITWPGNKDELITCRDGGVAGTRLCNSGSGCIFMLAGFPDECDQCVTKNVNGTYCGRDMPGWDAKNANFRVRCQGGAQVGLVLCNGACTSNGANSTCP